MPDRYAYPYTPEESGKICRQNALTAAVAWLKHQSSPPQGWTDVDVLQLAATFSHWTITGDMPAAQAQTEPQPEDDMPPF